MREQALVLFRKAGERKGEASTLSNIGAIHLIQGNNTVAIDYFNQSIAIYESLGEKVNVAISRNNIAVIYHETGNYQQALPYYEQALATFREINSKPEQIIFLRNIANVYAAWGDRNTAASYYAQALELARAVKSKRSEATLLQFIGNNKAKLGQTQEALQYLTQSVALHQEIGNRFGVADALKTLGTLHYQLGQYQEAVDKFNQSLAIAQPLNLAVIIANDHADLGHTYFALKDFARAREYFTGSLEFFSANGYRAQEATCLEMLARIEMREEQFGEALKHLERSLAIIEATRQRISLPELRASYFALSRGVYDAYIDTLMQLHQQNPNEGYAARALLGVERSRARTLLDTLIEANADIRQGVDPKLLEREKSLLSRSKARTDALRSLVTNGTPAQRAAAQQEYDALQVEYKTLQGQIRASSPRYAALTQPAPLTLPEIQSRVLDSDSVLLEYALGEKHSYLWVITDKQFRSYTLPPAAEIEQAARRVYDLITARNRVVKFETAEEKRIRVLRADVDYVQAAANLTQMLLTPAADQLNRKRLLIVGEGALQYLNFGGLPLPETNNQPLVTRHEIVSLPSASTLGILRRELQGRPQASKQVAVIADPVFGLHDERLATALNRRETGASLLTKARSSSQLDQLSRSLNSFEPEGAPVELPRLAHTRQEAKEINALVPPGQRWVALDFAATRQSAMNPDLSQYRILHFATHGLLNSKRPELSGLVFSLIDEHGQAQDGFLSLPETYELKLPADLVVLSACRTGLGQEIRGEGLVGLTRGFMYAGAARVLVSLWNVDDAATAELMRRFYQKMLGSEKLSPAAALRAAQLSLSQDRHWAAPYYWAGFILQGEPR
jgi:CHAT domain-containing protein